MIVGEYMYTYVCMHVYMCTYMCMYLYMCRCTLAQLITVYPYLQVCQLCTIEAGYDVQRRSHDQSEFKLVNRALEVRAVTETPDFEHCLKGEHKRKRTLKTRSHRCEEHH